MRLVHDRLAVAAQEVPVPGLDADIGDEQRTGQDTAIRQHMAKLGAMEGDRQVGGTLHKSRYAPHPAAVGTEAGQDIDRDKRTARLLGEVPPHWQ